jgi:hypothetical protein
MRVVKVLCAVTGPVTLLSALHEPVSTHCGALPAHELTVSFPDDMTDRMQQFVSE